MECPICGYDNMDAVAEDGEVKRVCPVCEGDPNWDKNIRRILDENRGAWEELAKGDEEE